jgi:hypothetical protein
MIYTAPYVMFLMSADPLRGQVGGGWALEIETFLGPVKWHRAVWRVPFGGQKVESDRQEGRKWGGAQMGGGGVYIVSGAVNLNHKTY